VLRLILITSRFFVSLLHLIDQNVAIGLNLTSGTRVGVGASCAKDMSRGSLTGLEIVSLFSSVYRAKAR
jgi:hypothetical protein